MIEYDTPEKHIGLEDGKFYALIGARDLRCYVVPWENRFDWEIKNIEPIELTEEEFSHLMKENRE